MRCAKADSWEVGEINASVVRGAERALPFCLLTVASGTSITRMKTLCLLVFLFSTVAVAAVERREQVFNGTFAELAGGLPAGWETSGSKTVAQKLSSAQARDGQPCVRLDCLAFSGDGPSTHAMVCQVGRVAVRKGQWYRLTFWAKAAGVKGGGVEVALTNMRPWENAGLDEAFTPQADWQRHEMLFRAKSDLPAATSRLQFWFKSTGTLWLGDVSLMESDVGQQWYPQIGTEGVKNFIPNSSFECGGAGWGSISYGLPGWAGNLYRLEGEVATNAPQHGAHCLTLALNPRTLPVYWFDYYEPVHQPVRRIFAANKGWFRVKPGERLTLSAWLRADAEDMPAEFVINECNGWTQKQQVKIGKEWQRRAFSFAPSQPFIFIAIGSDLDVAHRESLTLWLDAVQLERGERATAYEPRAEIESFIAPAAEGHVFIKPAEGLQLMSRTFNNSSRVAQLNGQLCIEDFFGRTVIATNSLIEVQAHGAMAVCYSNLCAGRQGYFRADWIACGATQSLRAALIAPADTRASDSLLGFNHAYPWDFLVRLARDAGCVWWRDWSAKWQTVEPEKGKFDFTVADAQVNRVLAFGSEVEVLLPFPSANWSSAAPAEVVTRAASGKYPDLRLPVSYAPKDQRDFDRYAAEVVRHYRSTQPRPVTTYQILNEPVYTDYALPRQKGYSLADYLKLLGSSYRALKAADPRCCVVGGISANLTAGLTREFVEQGGLNACDVFDLHMYNACVPAETYTGAFADLEQLMRAHGGPKPFWITEWGCYADDDPACVPQVVGDAAMNRCKWPSERAATEHIVKFTAIGVAHGLRKIFFHAGTCGTINNPDAGGVLFEYGGVPRKMYAGVAVLNRLLGVPESCARALERDDLRAYVFQKKAGAVAIVWSATQSPRELALPEDVRACDLMGNELPARTLKLTATPLYLQAAGSQELAQLFP